VSAPCSAGGKPSGAQLESNIAAAEIDLGSGEDQALRDTSDRFRLVTGAAALPRPAAGTGWIRLRFPSVSVGGALS
jgi:hypothetical protein